MIMDATLDLTFKAISELVVNPNGTMVHVKLGLKLVGAKLTRWDGAKIFDISTDTGAINLDIVKQIIQSAVQQSGVECEVEVKTKVVS